MSDLLVDNKHIYNLELTFLKCLTIVTKITFVLFLVGIFNNKPTFILEINSVVKFLLGIFLMYRFNSYRKNKVTFTELDRKICYSVGIYIVLISLGEYLITITDHVRNKIMYFTSPIITPIITFMKNNI
jgi:hypothetical protein